MRRTIALVLVLALFGARSGHAADSALGWSYKYVLTTTTVDTQLVPVMSGIVADSKLRDQEMCDLLAEVLSTFKAQDIPAKETAVQILRVLTNVPDAARYRNVVEGLGKYVSDKRADLYLKQFQRKYGRSKADQYVPGTINLEARRREYMQAALNSKPTQAQAQALADLPATATMDDVFAAAGNPAAVGSRDVAVADYSMVEIRQLWFYYRGIGRFAFDFKRDSGWHTDGFIADPMAFEGFMPYRARAAELGLPDDNTIATIQMLTGNASSIKSSAHDSYRRENPPLEYLDIAAETLLQHHAEIANTRANDAYAWICNLLADWGGPRYAAVLRTVEKETRDPKLEKFAARPVKEGLGSPATGYVPGSISLAEKAKQYPSLYPQVTLIRGML
jgi:hypothetical protein